MSDYEIAEAMRIYGGSFAQGLAHLFHLADPRNQLLIKRTWATEWAQYAELAALKAKSA